MSTRQTIQRSLQKFSAFGAIAVAVMGLLGYLPGMELLGRVKEDYIPMAPSTAVSFIILGITVMILNDKQKPGVKAITFLIVTFLVSLFGILEVAGHFSGIDLNFEDALVPAAGDLNGIPIARMSPATGAAFFLSGIAVFFLILQCRFPPRKSFNEYISSGSGILVLLISFVFCLAYFYGTPLLYGQGSTVPMALTTALGFLFLSVSILIFKKDVFPLRILTGPSTRSYLLRFVLPLSTLSVILGGVAVLSAHNASKMNPAFISGALTALIAIFAGFMATLMSRHMGSKIDRSEATIKVANEELRKAEQRYRTVANFTYDWEYWEGPEGTFRYISPSCERITGYKPEEFLENPQILQKLILPEDKALWDKHRQEAINKKGTLDVQFRIRKRDGQIRWIEHVCQPVTDEKGKFLGFRASNRDITARKQAEENITDHTKLLNLILRNSLDSIVLLDKNYNFIWVNETYAKACQRDSSEFAGHNHFEFYPSNLKEEFDVAKKGKSIYRKYARPFIFPDHPEWGETYWDLGLVPIFDDDGEIEMFLFTLKDITERKRAEEGLNRLREEYLHIARVAAIGELTASLAHELKQPLAAMRSNAQAAQRFLTGEKPDLDEFHDILTDIINDNRRADEVIGRLRTLMRKGNLQIADLNINKLIQEIFPLVHSYEIMRNISLEFELDDRLPSVAADRVQLQQVILNLLLNSSEALMDVSGNIRKIIVQTSQKDTQNVTVAIKDNGPGIDEQNVDRLFKPYYTTKKEGLGMGLAISRSIIEAHRGSLWAENNSGRGVTFYFTVPVFKRNQV